MPFRAPRWIFPSRRRAPITTAWSRLLPNKGWVEGVSQNPATDGSVTWNNQISLATGSTPWTTPGATNAADIDTTTTQSFDVIGNADQVTPTPVGRDITSWVQAWVNTRANNTGMVMWGGAYNDLSGEGRYFHFGVKENGTGIAPNYPSGPTLL